MKAAITKGITMKIVLCCASGMSTSMLVKKMQEAAVKKGVDVTISACPVTELDVKASDANVILLGPQVRYELSNVKSNFGDRAGVDAIDPRDYGMMRGDKVLDHAIEIAK